ncbi:hypothetical protein ACUN9V_04975 [Salinicola sp. V024]|uniref:hypothetical protein n=1 Tax=Salinicola sp. V024 TaxID=3459609 RepID=UPI0040445069
MFTVEPHPLVDERNKCISIMTVMSVDRYLSLVYDVYGNKGNIEGQRAPLKTTTASKIRGRMVQDIRDGTVLPPLVLGAVVDGDFYRKLVRGDGFSIEDFVQRFSSDISIIDGMQRTTALIEALEGDELTRREIRVEFWMSEDVHSLIYRMLILNTGQVPWDIVRQLDTVYKSLLNKIKEKVVNVSEIFVQSEESRRRTKAGQYQSKAVIELFLTFSSRRTEVDLKDRVAEDFAKLDMVEALSNDLFLDYFVKVFDYLAKFDTQFDRISDAFTDEGQLKFTSGRKVFAAFPALVGFVTAFSNFLFKGPGFAIDWDAAEEKMQDASDRLDQLLKAMSAMDENRLRDFLQLDLLNTALSNRKVSQVGRNERDFFRQAFASMIDNAYELTDMSPCWRAQG